MSMANTWRHFTLTLRISSSSKPALCRKAFQTLEVNFWGESQRWTPKIFFFGAHYLRPFPARSKQRLRPEDTCKSRASLRCERSAQGQWLRHDCLHIRTHLFQVVYRLGQALAPFSNFNSNRYILMIVRVRFWSQLFRCILLFCRCIPLFHRCILLFHRCILLFHGFYGLHNPLIQSFNSNTKQNIFRSKIDALVAQKDHMFTL